MASGRREGEYIVHIRPPRWTDSSFWIRADNFEDAVYMADAVNYFIGRGPYHLNGLSFKCPPLCLGTRNLLTREGCSAYVQCIAKGRAFHKERADYKVRVQQLVRKAAKSKPLSALFLKCLRPVTGSVTNFKPTEDGNIVVHANKAAMRGLAYNAGIEVNQFGSEIVLRKERQSLGSGCGRSGRTAEELKAWSTLAEFLNTLEKDEDARDEMKGRSSGVDYLDPKLVIDTSEAADTLEAANPMHQLGVRQNPQDHLSQYVSRWELPDGIQDSDIDVSRRLAASRAHAGTSTLLDHFLDLEVIEDRADVLHEHVHSGHVEEMYSETSEGTTSIREYQQNPGGTSLDNGQQLENLVSIRPEGEGDAVTTTEKDTEDSQNLIQLLGPCVEVKALSGGCIEHVENCNTTMSDAQGAESVDRVRLFTGEVWLESQQQRQGLVRKRCATPTSATQSPPRKRHVIPRECAVSLEQKSCKKWTDQETSELLSAMMGGRFYRGKRGGMCWDIVNIKDAEGHRRTKTQCQNRYDVLLKAYKTMKGYVDKTGKPISEITEKDRRDMKLATPLRKEWYKDLDKFFCQRGPA